VLAPAFFGSGEGPLSRVDPPVRLLAGAVALAACVAAPARSAPGAIFVALLAAAALLVAAPPSMHALRLLGFGLALHLPFLLVLVALLLADRSLAHGAGAALGAAPAAFATAGTLALKGLASLVVTLSVVCTLRPAELQTGLSRLPLPAGVRLLLIQIVHQSGLLLEETVRLRQVLAVRGAARGFAPSVSVMAGLPAVWLARVAHRADRVAAAMEVRGYATQPLPAPSAPGEWRRPEFAAAGVAAALLATALLLHLLP
jgi:energy-coupling factor transporter transmembrane protein EcfT